MGRKTIVWCRDDDGDGRHLAYRDPEWGVDGPPADDATLEDLADLCDEQAEAVNAHDYHGAHRLLAAVLHRHAGRGMATDVMRDIARMGGLHGMNGVCSDEDASGELGVPGPWEAWKLP